MPHERTGTCQKGMWLQLYAWHVPILVCLCLVMS
jgi:hypothetical protein